MGAAVGGLCGWGLPLMLMLMLVLVLMVWPFAVGISGGWFMLILEGVGAATTAVMLATTCVLRVLCSSAGLFGPTALGDVG